MPRPVVTVTLNPAIDLTVVAPDMQLGKVNRASSAQSNAGGKGVNVASCLADWSVPVSAAGILGAGNTGPFEALFAAKGIRDLFVRTTGETRTNIKIADPARNQTTDVNLPGPSVDDAVLEGMCDCRGARGHLQFGEDVGDVAMDRALAEMQLPRDRSILLASGDETQYLDLSLG